MNAVVEFGKKIVSNLCRQASIPTTNQRDADLNKLTAQMELTPAGLLADRLIAHFSGKDVKSSQLKAEAATAWRESLATRNLNQRPVGELLDEADLLIKAAIVAGAKPANLFAGVPETQITERLRQNTRTAWLNFTSTSPI